VLDGQRYVIRAGIHTISGYSAHADQKDLLNFVKRMRHKPGQIRIVHGDYRAKQTLQQKFKELLPQAEVVW
jgi:metallo-beta-lactamase family protein